MEKLIESRTRPVTARHIQIVFLSCSVLLFFTEGLFSSPQNQGVGSYDVGVSLLYAGILFWWYHADSEERQIRRPVALNMLVIALAPLGILIYTLWWDKSRKALKVLAKFFGIVLLHLAAATAGGLLHPILN
jgi:cytochrome bd-type quinol oxidase subunit 2